MPIQVAAYARALVGIGAGKTGTEHLCSYVVHALMKSEAAFGNRSPSLMRREENRRMTAMVTRRGALDMQVCVPADWTDVDVKTFADQANPCGTENGWRIRKDGDPGLGADGERVPCSDSADHIHIMLDA